MIKLKQILLEGMGDCYQAAGRLIMSKMNGKLVHGMVHGQGPLNGLKFGHAWVEVGGKVLDYSNNQKRSLPKKVYYILGAIDPAECHYYSGTEAAKKMLKHKHWGPWDMTGTTVKSNPKDMVMKQYRQLQGLEEEEIAERKDDIVDKRGEMGRKREKIPMSILKKL